ncbi:FAD-dependent monooxygenase [Neobacillus cucumis]|uniref:FAD-dependent monooxygenase n=1 Tax=Neobacillus cucumis TaxID=1740721 RepID=UPI002E24A711|nr:FAD-dependent monooxygenase [Neobacillus cucumis]MED4227785.1 FAD-dependent monooxygenase [Neobacillus cucumis]
MVNQFVKKVLIVGGGISGLAAAAALHKIGIKAEIVEKELEWNVYGVGIIQPPNALRALNEIGLADVCMQEGYSYPGFDYYTGQGHFMFKGDSPTIEGYPGVNGISRRKLHEFLLEAVEKIDTKIYMGSTVERIENISHGVKVELSNGISAVYDMVIGADGANSRVRKLLFGDIVQKYSGQGVWRYTLPRPKEVDRGLFYYGQKAKAGLVPMSEDEMYLLVTTHEPGNPKFPNEQLHVLLKERLTEFGGAIEEAANQLTDPDQVVYRPIFTHMLAKPWYKGNVLLVGDAAHGTAPHLGQGASIAIEDVIVLADILKSNIGVEETFKIFMEKRYERCRLIVDNSDQLVEWELLTWSRQMKEDVNVGKFVHETLAKMNEPLLTEVNTL